MQINPESPHWNYYSMNVKIQFLDRYYKPLNEPPQNFVCFAFLRTLDEQPFFRSIKYLRYYFNQHIPDNEAKRFFRKIKHWWFIGHLLTDSARQIVNQGYITLDLQRHSYFRIFATLTLVRFIDDFSFLAHEVFKAPTKKHLLVEFIAAHRKCYSLLKNPSELSPKGYSVSTNHGFYSPYSLTQRDIDKNIPLEQDNPNVIKEPVSFPITAQPPKHENLNSVFNKL